MCALNGMQRNASLDIPKVVFCLPNPCSLYPTVDERLTFHLAKTGVVKENSLNPGKNIIVHAGLLYAIEQKEEPDIITEESFLCIDDKSVSVRVNETRDDSPEDADTPKVNLVVDLRIEIVDESLHGFHWMKILQMCFDDSVKVVLSQQTVSVSHIRKSDGRVLKKCEEYPVYSLVHGDLALLGNQKPLRILECRDMDHRNCLCSLKSIVGDFNTSRVTVRSDDMDVCATAEILADPRHVFGKDRKITLLIMGTGTTSSFTRGYPRTLDFVAKGFWHGDRTTVLNGFCSLRMRSGSDAVTLVIHMDCRTHTCNVDANISTSETACLHLSYMNVDCGKLFSAGRSTIPDILDFVFKQPVSDGDCQLDLDIRESRDNVSDNFISKTKSTMRLAFRVERPDRVSLLQFIKGCNLARLHDEEEGDGSVCAGPRRLTQPIQTAFSVVDALRVVMSYLR